VDGFVPSIVPYRKFASRIFLPYTHELLEAGSGNAMPFGFVAFDCLDVGLPNGIASQDVAYGNVTQPGECWLTHLTASSWLTAGGTQADGITAGNFAVQFYDADRQKLWSEVPIPVANALGGFGSVGPASGFLPLYLKRLYRMPTNGALQARVINLSTDTNRVQIVAWGIRQ
jgi:hypothetical protein